MGQPGSLKCPRSRRGIFAIEASACENGASGELPPDAIGEFPYCTARMEIFCQYPVTYFGFAV